MPLINSSSNKARNENIATEIKAGKDPKQAAAIAYSVQRKNAADNGQCALLKQLVELLKQLP